MAAITINLDEAEKGLIERAAPLRGVSVEEYARTIALAQARAEAHSADLASEAMSPKERIAFWNALARPAPLAARRSSEN
jgi:hypothetical protein